MPLDGHSYLVSQGWGGKGTALREGAISRPITVAQKKNLGGLGKDRDEAFPFWDHLFSAAAKSIQIRYTSDDEDGSDSSTTTTAVMLKRTSTGILSTRRPVEGTPAASGSTTPSTDTQAHSDSRLSLVAHAKREAAKRGLYSRFFRGPVLGPEAIEVEEKRLVALVSESFDKQNPHVEKMTIKEHIEVEMEDHERVVVDLEVSKAVKHKRRKGGKEKAVDGEASEEEEERRARKKRRKEEKRRKAVEEDTEAVASTSRTKEKKHRSKSKDKDSQKSAATPTATNNSTSDDVTSTSPRKDKKRKSKSKSQDDAAPSPATPSPASVSTPIPEVGNAEVVESKEERTRRKEEKRRLKALRKAEALASSTPSEPTTATLGTPKPSKSSRRQEYSSSHLENSINVDAIAPEEPRKKKKRKRAEE